MPTEDYSISHTGQVLDPSNVDRMQNQVAPQRETPILSFTCPDNFDLISYVGQRDPTFFIPRSMESATLTDDSGNFNDSDRTVALSTSIQPINGEPDLDDQDYLCVEVVNVTQGGLIDAADLSVDYAANEVTISDTAVAAGDDVKVFPVIVEGELKLYGVNNLGQTQGAVDKWGFPLRRFADFKMHKRGTEIKMAGGLSFETYESLEVHVDSPRQIVWEDADHPDAYVSSFEQDVEITF